MSKIGYQMIRIVSVLLCVSTMWCTENDKLLADVFVSAASRNSVLRFDDNGNFLGDFVSPGLGGLSDPQGIKFGPNGNLYVSSNGSNNVLEFDGQDGSFIGVAASLPDMNWPAEINFRNGLLYVSDFSSANSVGRVSRFNVQTNTLVDHFIVGANFADGLSWNTDGNIVLSEFGSNAVRIYDGQTGVYIEDFITPNQNGLASPLDNLFLPNGNFLVSSYNNSRVMMFDANGNYISDPFGAVTFPQGLEIGPDGNIYVGSFTQGIIRKYDINTFQFLGIAANANGLSTTNNFTFGPPAAIPEPASGILFAGIVISALLVRRARHVQR
jgi:WD40 repeat protein